MSEFPVFPLFVSDYLADTWELDGTEHGAYLLILIHYWKQRRGPESDSGTLKQVTRLDAKRWNKISPKVMHFFEVREGRLYHKRLEKELRLAAEKHEKRVEAGRKGAKAKLSIATSFATSNAQAMLLAKHKQPEPEPELEPLKPTHMSEPADSDMAGSTDFSRSKKPSAQVPRSDKDALFSFWIRTCKMGPPDPKMTSSRLKLLNARLDDGFSMDDLAMAIVGCSRNPHNRGENDRGTKFMGWDLIMRNADKVTYFIECYRRLKK